MALPLEPQSSDTHGSSPITHLSWPGGISKTEPASISRACPPSMTIRRAPDRVYPTWRTWHDEVPISGATSVDQRQPGSNAQRPGLAAAGRMIVITAPCPLASEMSTGLCCSKELRDSGRHPNDAEDDDRDRRSRRSEGRPLRVRTRLALVDRCRAARRNGVVPGTPRRVHAVGRPADRHGRRTGARDRGRLGLRDPAGPRQMGDRGRAVGVARLGRQRAGHGGHARGSIVTDRRT